MEGDWSYYKFGQVNGERTVMLMGVENGYVTEVVNLMERE